MSALWQTVAVIAAMGCLNVGGALAFKQHVLSDSAGMLVLGGCAWALGAVLYIRLLGMQDLSSVGLASAVIQTCLVITSGVLLFGETVSLRQALAMSIAIAAMTLAMLPETPR